MAFGLTACTSGFAPGATLGSEYGKPLPFHYDICFPGEVGFVGPPQFSSSTCSGRERLRINGKGFYGLDAFLSLTQPTVSKYRVPTHP